jgi:hypothetical protein
MNICKIQVPGIITFEPENRTRKHMMQSSWKKVAMVNIEGDICEYYAWMLNRRYNLILNKPLRGAHISFINDSMKDLGKDGLISDEEVEKNWEEVKARWDGREIMISLDVVPKTDDLHWWLNIPHEDREELQWIRNELGLGKPHWGMHMSIGYANDKNIEHSRYIHRTIKMFEI